MSPNLNFLREKIHSHRIISLCGGTRSGKTYSALQFIIELCYNYSGLTISICRATLPALKATAMRDFFDMLISSEAYDERKHNKTEGLYDLWGNTVEFFSLDQPAKVRGRDRKSTRLNSSHIPLSRMPSSA